MDILSTTNLFLTDLLNFSQTQSAINIDSQFSTSINYDKISSSIQDIQSLSLNNPSKFVVQLLFELVSMNGLTNITASEILDAIVNLPEECAFDSALVNSSYFIDNIYKLPHFYYKSDIFGLNLELNFTNYINCLLILIYIEMKVQQTNKLNMFPVNNIYQLDYNTYIDSSFNDWVASLKNKTQSKYIKFQPKLIIPGTKYSNQVIQKLKNDIQIYTKNVNSLSYLTSYDLTTAIFETTPTFLNTLGNFITKQYNRLTKFTRLWYPLKIQYNGKLAMSYWYVYNYDEPFILAMTIPDQNIICFLCFGNHNESFKTTISNIIFELLH